MVNTYILLDSALVPNIWQYLAFNLVPFKPLYRYSHTHIKTVLPYLVKLDKAKSPKIVNEFLTKAFYHSGLIIQSEHNLSELIEKLRYFYHIVNEKNEPLLRRFFDLRIFPTFVKGLSETHLDFLFSHQTTFYYLTENKEAYYRVSITDNRLVFDSISLNTLRETIK